MKADVQCHLGAKTSLRISSLERYMHTSEGTVEFAAQIVNSFQYVLTGIRIGDYLIYKSLPDVTNYSYGTRSDGYEY